MAKAVITEKGREKLCKAHAGQIILPIITKMGFGQGGVDADGNVIDTTGNETALKDELLQKNIEGFTFPINTTCRYKVRLNKEDLANKFISEQGLYDADGDLIAYKTFLPKGKDDDSEFVFDLEEIF